MLGEGKTEYHMNNAFFFISAGTNDYVINYFSVPIRRNYTPLTYGQFLLQHVKDFIQVWIWYIHYTLLFHSIFIYKKFNLDK